MLLQAHDPRGRGQQLKQVSLGVHARCITLQEVPQMQISVATAALVQESVKGDSLVETNEEQW